MTRKQVARKRYYKTERFFRLMHILEVLDKPILPRVMTAKDIQTAIPETVSLSTVRGDLRHMEDNGWVRRASRPRMVHEPLGSLWVDGWEITGKGFQILKGNMV